MGRDITPVHPIESQLTVAIPHDRALYRCRHKIENMVGQIKERAALTRYGCCAHTFVSAIRIEATVIFWICNELILDITCIVTERRHQKPQIESPIG